MRYGSVCSGIEAATVAWHPLGWKPAFFSEIAKFPRAVLAHHYPDVPCHGDFTTIRGDEYGPFDLLVGGTPCQDFSVAGLRAGIAGDRGNLTLEFLRLAARVLPSWIVWENVPGVLSSDGGRAFGAFLGGLGELGYGFAYRVLDAQFSGLAQRRERVFVVGYLGDWRRAAAVLFEREGLRWNPAPSREARQAVAALTANGVGTCGADDNQAQAGHLIAFGGNNTSGPVDVATAVNTHGGPHGRQDFASETFVTVGTMSAAGPTDKKHGHGWGQQEWENGYAVPVLAHSLRAEGFDASEDGTGRGIPLTLAIRGRGDDCNLEWRQDGLANALMTPNGGRAGMGVGAVAFTCKDHGADVGELSPTLRAMGHSASHANVGGQVAVAFAQNTRDEVRLFGGDGLTVGALAVESGMKQTCYIASPMMVRRLTPRECERLQGFPDNYTLIPYRGKPAADGPRYMALGNSMAVPVMRWIGERIELVESLANQRAVA